MGFEISDDDLVQMSTSELRSLLTKRLVTAEEHKQLRSRRRRLQNRKYARRCAHKKITEVENLNMELQEETSEIQSLRRQLLRINLATQCFQHQTTGLARFRHSLESNQSGQAKTVRMLLSDGKLAGLAHSIEQSNRESMIPYSLPTSHPSSLLARGTSAHIDNLVSTSSSSLHTACPDSFCCSSSSKPSFQTGMPVQLAAGLGMPSNQNPPPYAWSPTAANSLSSRLPMRLVRPVGCGVMTNGRNSVEY